MYHRFLFLDINKEGDCPEGLSIGHPCLGNANEMVMCSCSFPRHDNLMYHRFLFLDINKEGDCPEGLSISHPCLGNANEMVMCCLLLEGDRAITSA